MSIRIDCVLVFFFKNGLDKSNTLLNVQNKYDNISKCRLNWNTTSCQICTITFLYPDCLNSKSCNNLINFVSFSVLGKSWGTLTAMACCVLSMRAGPNEMLCYIWKADRIHMNPVPADCQPPVLPWAVLGICGQLTQGAGQEARSGRWSGWGLVGEGSRQEMVQSISQLVFRLLLNIQWS